MRLNDVLAHNPLNDVLALVTYYLLTFKQAGRTRLVYVPKDLVKQAQSWIRSHRRVKQVLSEISTISIAIIRRHVAQTKASARDGGEKRLGEPSGR